MPEDLEVEVNTQRESLVLKASFKNLDEVHVINDLNYRSRESLSLTLPILLAKLWSKKHTIIVEVDPNQKRQNNAEGMGNVVSGADNSSFPSCDETKLKFSFMWWDQAWK